MGKPLTFSVGIPTFNQAEFLGDTIESLLKQTRPPDEIVISDHYSTDHTLAVVDRYRGRVRLVQPPSGVNLTGQYNFTLSSQSCDWITLLSSDDVARPIYCETLMRGAARREDAALVRAGWENIDGDGRSVGVNFMLRSPKVELPPETLLSQKYGPKVSFAAFAVRRKVYEKSGPIFQSLESLADWALFVQLAPFGAFIYENELIAGYRVGHDGNKFRKRIGMWLRDEQRMFYEVMPLAAERAGIKDLTWIDEASRANFLRYIASSSLELRPDERTQIVPLFESWAERVGGQRYLQKFAAGENVTVPASLFLRGKRLVRPFAQQLYSQLRKGR